MKERKFMISFENIRRSKIDHIWHDTVDHVQSESRAGNRLARALPIYCHISMFHIIEIAKKYINILYRQIFLNSDSRTKTLPLIHTCLSPLSMFETHPVQLVVDPNTITNTRTQIKDVVECNLI